MAGRGDIILHKTRLATAIPTIKEKKIMVGLWLSRLWNISVIYWIRNNFPIFCYVPEN